MKIIRCAEQKTVNWAGGTAIQMAIWPEDATYDGQQFLWRMSAAAITEENTRFTHIPDYRRFMGIREGALLVNHGTNLWHYINARNVVTWDAAVPTFSRGLATNMNLMIRKDRGEGAMQSVLTRASYRGSMLQEFFDIREAVQGSAMDVGRPRPKMTGQIGEEIFGLYVSSGDDIELQEKNGASACLHSGDLALWELGDDWNHVRILSCGESRLFGVWVMRK